MNGKEHHVQFFPSGKRDGSEADKDMTA